MASGIIDATKEASTTGTTGPKSMIGAFLETVKKRGSDPAVRFRGQGGAWSTYTWAQMDELRKALAAGMIELGFSARERANVLSNSSEKWMLADLAIQSSGGETVPIYQSNLSHEVEYIINDCGAVWVFAENQEQLQKLQKERAKLGKIRKVVMMNGAGDGTDWTITWDDLLKLGKDQVGARGADIDARTNLLGPSDVLTIIYTSGTTGHPKGVVLPHSAMLYEVEGCLKVGVIDPKDLQFLFLPMAHVFAKVLQSIWLATGHEMAIDADINAITKNLGEVRPTVVCSVPRIFEKVYAKVVGGGLEAPGLKGKLFKWAIGLNDQVAQLKIEGKTVPFGLEFQLNLAKKLVFSKVQARLTEIFGGRLRYFVSGGAPLPKKMAYFFENAGVTILEGYGLTETSAATCVNRLGQNKIGTVGPALPGTELKIAPDGEILIRGPGVMREYWQKPEATKEVLAADGWFSTGDIGVIDQDGYLKITDRKKDIIVTAGGKNVAPQNLENQIKSANPLISQVMVHGDKRKFLSALFTLEPEAAKKLGEANGVTGGYEAVTKSEAAKKAIQATLDTINAQLASYETVKKFEILPKDFEVGVELTPTLKVKRKFCNEKYKAILDGFYDEKILD
ncbi:MAG: long-chain fatty acid--CoA ligase [Deltaproteobacteria bacterium]|jgi:long-chain acyl-CoA synthetase|nr:long-chain fatty acid--CoA ligase [Deltaproteobacteria bacterium]